MKVTTMTVSAYSNPTGNIVLIHEGTAINISLTVSEANELMSMGIRIFERRQQEIAQQIADMKPELLPAPNVVEGEYTNVDDYIAY